MNKKNTRFKNKELRRIYDENICPICLNIYQNPVTTNCNHSFCEDCIIKFQNYEEKKINRFQLKISKTCPVCRSEYSTLEENFSISNFLIETKTFCLNDVKYGCKWKGNLKGLGFHIENCVKFKGKKLRKRNSKHNRIEKNQLLEKKKRKTVKKEECSLKELMKELRKVRNREVIEIDLESEVEIISLD